MAVVFAAILSVTMVTPAFAADPAYKVTVDNSANTSVSIVGKTYTAYKLFDVTYTGSGKTDPHAYSIDSDGAGSWAWATLTNGVTADANGVYNNTTYGLKFTPSATDPTVYSVESTMTDAQARSLADALQSAISGATAAGSVQAAAETAEISLTEPGYFLVYGTAKAKDPANQADEVVAAVALTTADPAETVIPKVSIPTLDKKITGQHKLDDAGKAAAAQVGTTVDFELDSIVPDLTGYTDYTFTFTDTLTDGLDYVADSWALKINDVTVDIASCTFDHAAATPRKFTLTIPFSILNTYKAGDAIVLTYSAKVNENALQTDYEKNTAKLTYSHSPYDTDTKDTPDKQTYVIDLNIDVDKVANEATGNKLPNAKFKLFKGDTKPADTDASWYKWNTTDKKVEWVAKADADEFATDNSGNLTTQIAGLEAEATGTKYGLVETVAPTGYNLLAEPVIVTLTGAYDATTNKATITATNATVTNETIDLTAAQNANQPVATATVINKSGTELPSTGGIGTTIFYVVGGAMVIGGGIFLITKRRMSAE